METVFLLESQIFIVIRRTLGKTTSSRRLASPWPMTQIPGHNNPCPLSSSHHTSHWSASQHQWQDWLSGATSQCKSMASTSCQINTVLGKDREHPGAQRQTLALIFEQQTFLLRVTSHSLYYWKYLLFCFRCAWPDSSSESDFSLYTIVLYIFQVTQNVSPRQAEISLPLPEAALLQLCRGMRFNHSPLCDGYCSFGLSSACPQSSVCVIGDGRWNLFLRLQCIRVCSKVVFLVLV